MWFAKTTAPETNRGRQLERVGLPDTACANRRALRPPIRAAKNGGTDNEAADSAVQKLRLASQRCFRRPIPITPFFDVTGRVYLLSWREINDLGARAWQGCSPQWWL